MYNQSMKYLMFILAAALSSCDSSQVSSQSAQPSVDQEEQQQAISYVNKNVYIKIIGQSYMPLGYSVITYSIQTLDNPSWLAQDESLLVSAGSNPSKDSASYTVSRAAFAYSFSQCNLSVEVEVYADNQLIRTDTLSNGNYGAGCTTRRIYFNLEFAE